jgi:putative phosphoribosyl transferase
VALILQNGGLATLLVDLLEEQESLDREKVFDIDLLAERLLASTQWLSDRAEMKGLSFGYFGASTGAAAALQAAAQELSGVTAIVSRGGRPDLAMKYLPHVKAPTLLIVGGEDSSVIPLNEAAYERLDCPKQMVIVPGATHLFEESGALERVGNLACEWFLRYLLPKA